jgi:hypothetical protein
MDDFMQFPAPLDLPVAWLPDWSISVTTVVALVLLAWWLHALIFRPLTRAASERSLF